MNRKQITGKRDLVSVLISFLLCLLFSALFITLSMRVGICNREIFTRSVSNSEYYEVLYEKLSENLCTLIEESGLPKSVADGVIEDDQVYIDGKVYITSVLKGKHPAIATDDIQDRLYTNVETYLEEHQISMDSLQKGVQEMIDTVDVDYRNTVEFKMADYFYRYSTSINRWGMIVLGLNVVCGTILIVLLLSMYHNKYKGIRYITAAVFVATIINTVFTLHCFKMISGWSILQGDSYYSLMAKSYLSDGIRQGYYISLVGVILVFMLLIITQMIKSRKS